MSKPEDVIEWSADKAGAGGCLGGKPKAAANGGGGGGGGAR